MWRTINFDSSDIGNDCRLSANENYLLGCIESGRKSYKGIAFCIVSVVDIELERCNEDKYVNIPVKIKIDRIIDSNDAFLYREGEEVYTTEYSRWKKEDNDFTVNIQSGYIPLTDIGAEYIVLLYDNSYKIIESVDFEYDVFACNFTIPISQPLYNDEYADLIYSKMLLPNDVKECSEELISKYIRS